LPLITVNHPQNRSFSGRPYLLFIEDQDESSTKNKRHKNADKSISSKL